MCFTTIETLEYNTIISIKSFDDMILFILQNKWFFFICTVY